MASRFWTQGESDTEDEETDIEDEEVPVVPSVSGVGASRYLTGDGSDSDDSDTQKRVVRSTKDKRFDEMLSTVDQMKNAMKINDWVSLQESFDKINKQLEKVMRLTESEKVPRVYIKSLVMLEDFLTQSLSNKEARKKMSSSNAKALNSMKQKLKKNSKLYEELIIKYRENPESEGDGDDAENDDDDDGDDEIDEDDDDEVEAGGDSEHSANEHEPGSEEPWDHMVNKKDKLFLKDPSEITWEMVNKKFREIVAERGRKGTQKMEQVERLVYLMKVAKSPAQRLEILFSVVSAQFDINPGLSGCMPVAIWKRCVDNVFAVLDILAENPNIVVDDTVEMDEHESEKGADFEGTIRIWGNLSGSIDRLDAEFFKSLQCTDPHTRDYVERMKDEPSFLALAGCVQDHLERSVSLRSAAWVALKRIELVYYKPQAVYDAMRRLSDDEGDQTSKRRPMLPASSREMMDKLLSVVYKHGDERTKVRATICDVFHRAVAGDFSAARDLVLIHRLQDSVPHADVSSQILFNRAMAQLGLCGFRAGLVHEAHACLMELYAGGRVRELLAQGVSQSRYHEKTPEQERIEKRRQMPYHTHINLELLEAVHLVSAMLLEVPNMAAAGGGSGVSVGGGGQRVVSRTFRRLFEASERQTFTGPPENVRDHVLAAARALFSGDWKRSFAIVSSMDVWKDDQRVLGMLRERMKEEALRTYLLMYSAAYRAVAIDELVKTFELSYGKVHSVVSRMMVAEELCAGWDQPARCVVFRDVEPTRMQMLAFQFTEKLSVLVDANERAMEARTGGGLDSLIAKKRGDPFEYPAGAVGMGGKWQQDGAASGGAGRSGYGARQSAAPFNLRAGQQLRTAYSSAAVHTAARTSYQSGTVPATRMVSLSRALRS